MLGKGAKTQEYFVYFKFEQRIFSAKAPQRADGVLIQRFLADCCHPEEFFSPVVNIM